MFTRSILSTAACDVYVWLKTTGAAIEIVKETTNNQYNKYSFGETCTETTIFIQEDK